MASALTVGTFLYFAYGSNLLESRLKISNPSAEFVDVGVLKDFRLDFVAQNQNWGGSVGTIIPTLGSSVWGTVWRMSNSHLATLDIQEGVPSGKYFRLTANITNAAGIVYECLTYRHTLEVAEPVALSDLPEDRSPSAAYLAVIVRGAKNSGLPHDYVENLKSIHYRSHDLNAAFERIKLNPYDVLGNGTLSDLLAKSS